jgi:hypothetical protein
MKFVMHDEMPSSGEFVAIWTYEGMLRSDNLIWKNGQLYYWQFNEETQDYEKREIASYPDDFGEEILTYIT